MDYLSFHEWVKQQDPKEVIDHSSWQSCAFGKYMAACHGFDASDWPDNDESLLRFIAEEDDCDGVSGWLFVMDEYLFKQASFVETLLIAPNHPEFLAWVADRRNTAISVSHLLSANNYEELNASLGYIKEFID